MKHTAVFDMESAGSVGYPWVYDLGLLIVNEAGDTIFSQEWTVAEVITNKMVMLGSFVGKEKYSKYVNEVFPVTGKSWLAIQAEVNHILEAYEVEEITSYNVGYDMRGITSTHWILGGVGNFFHREYKVYDAYTLAQHGIFQTMDYLEVATKNGWKSQSGKGLAKSAECAYRYITGTDMSQAHTALEDATNLVTILQYCWNKVKRINYKTTSDYQKTEGA